MLNRIASYISHYVEQAVLRGVASAVAKLIPDPQPLDGEAQLTQQLVAMNAAATPTHPEIVLPPATKPRRR